MPYTPMSERKKYDGFGRIQLNDDALDTEIVNIKNPANLSNSVGSTGQNTRRDVAKVETMLDQAGALDLKQTDGPTGYWGTRTADATKKIQADNDLAVDAEIKPNGPTIQKLRQITDTRHAAKRRKERRDKRRVDAAAAGKRSVFDQAKQSAASLKHDATRWHFEDRDTKNKPLPNSMRRADRAGFEMYPLWQNIEHQNDVGFPEVKYIHPDGREVIFDGDTRKIVTDSEIKGTFNYANAPATKPESLAEWINFFTQKEVIAHGILDYLPHHFLNGARKQAK